MTSWFIDMTSNSEVNENICNHFEKIIQDFKASLIEAETIQRDPAFYLDDYFSEVKRQVDLKKKRSTKKSNNTQMNVFKRLRKFTKIA